MNRWVVVVCVGITVGIGGPILQHLGRTFLTGLFWALIVLAPWSVWAHFADRSNNNIRK